VLFAFFQSIQRDWHSRKSLSNAQATREYYPPVVALGSQIGSFLSLLRLALLSQITKQTAKLPTPKQKNSVNYRVKRRGSLRYRKKTR